MWGRGCAGFSRGDLWRVHQTTVSRVDCKDGVLIFMVVRCVGAWLCVRAMFGRVFLSTSDISKIYGMVLARAWSSLVLVGVLDVCQSGDDAFWTSGDKYSSS